VSFSEIINYLSLIQSYKTWGGGGKNDYIDRILPSLIQPRLVFAYATLGDRP
jgi:hypothetical protein